MDRTQLESVAAEYPHLRGLFLLPLGIIVIASGLGNMEWGPFRELWTVPALYLLAALACLPIGRFYRQNYGRVQISKRAQVRGAMGVVVGVLLIIGGSLMDYRLGLPIWGFLGAFAVLMLTSYVVSVGIKAHHKLIWGAVLVAAVLPVWGGMAPDAKSNLGLVVVGLGVIVTGVLDHLLLVRSFGTVANRSIEA
jgi:hypothetical protein